MMRQPMNSNIEQALGHAMLDADFRESLFSDPEEIGRELGFDDKDIALLKSMDRQDFAEFNSKLNAQMAKLPVIIIFCATY